MSDLVITKEALLKAGLPEADFEIPDTGTVRVRGMSRAEVLEFVELEREPREVHALVRGMVDPALTEDEVQTWRSNTTSAVIKAVTDEILRLSGMLGDPVKEAKRSFPEGQ